MEASLNQKHLNVEFTPEQVQMFVDIVDADIPLKRVLLYIGKYADSHKNDELPGPTIAHLQETIVIHRKVRNKAGANIGTFSKKETNIDRKHVEKLVDTLTKMSLCYYVSVHPSKLLYLTKRGRQVAAEIVRRSQKK